MHHASNKKVIIHSSSGAHVIKDFVHIMSLKMVSYHMLYNPHSLFFLYATSAHTLRGLPHLVSRWHGCKDNILNHRIQQSVIATTKTQTESQPELGQYRTQCEKLFQMTALISFLHADIKNSLSLLIRVECMS